MRFRLAKIGDAKRLASVHLSCAADLRNSFTCQLGRLWLQAYYEVMLSDLQSVVICAEDVEGQIVGFHSGSLDCQKQQSRLGEHRVKLLVYALPALLMRPRLLRGMYNRYRTAGKGYTDSTYIVGEGARGEFLAVLKSARSASLGIDLITNWFGVMEALQAGPIQFEVDGSNVRVCRIHHFLGANRLRTFITPDGIERHIMCYPENRIRH